LGLGNSRSEDAAHPHSLVVRNVLRRSEVREHRSRRHDQGHDSSNHDAFCAATYSMVAIRNATVSGVTV
jgi:hypothetical protein